MPTRRILLALHVVCDLGVAPPMPDEWLTRVAQSVLDATAPDLPAERVEMALLLAGDPTLRRLNRVYRGKDQPTDVLSFGQLEGGSDTSFAMAPEEPLHLGDVAISVERAHSQARAYGHSFQRELAYLLTHGVLHLLGYDHQDDGERAAMRRVEEAALAALALARDPQSPEEE